MSKSLGNFVTVHELLEQGVPGEAIRLALLSTHYRDPLDWTDERLEQAKATLDRWYRALSLGEISRRPSRRSPKVVEALEDDLNTPQAIATAHLHRACRRGVPHRGRRAETLAPLQAELAAPAALLGTAEPRDPLQMALTGRLARRGRTDRMQHRRRGAPARKERRFADADRIRAELADEGIVLEDRPDGTTEWRRVR